MGGVSNYISFFYSLIIVFIISLFIVRKIIKKSDLVILILFFKFSFFAIYFLTWTPGAGINLSDDIVYYRDSLAFYNRLQGDILALFNEGTIIALGGITGGSHFGYHLYNFMCYAIFGPYYYSPVLMNVFVSILTGVVIYKTLLLASISEKIGKFFFIFFLLHWDIITWSSFINLKDIFVLFLTSLSLFCIIYFQSKSFNIKKLALLLISLFLLQYFRFYIVYFLLLTAFIYYVFNFFRKINLKGYAFLIKFSITIVIPIVFYILFITFFGEKIAEISDGGDGRTNVLIGSFRYILTPIPFMIEEKYSFLLISSIMHWLFIPILIYGIFIFVRRYVYILMPYVIIFVLLSVFYGSFAELQGPRHRVVVLFFISTMQALGWYNLLKRNKS